MQNRDRLPPAERPPLPAFTPVPRAKNRHDGWTPARQIAFIQALAESASVTIAARSVNMAFGSAYSLRLHPEAGEFRAAWEAALACGLQRLRDEAFDRAVNGQLVPQFYQGRVIGFRRIKNDRLLISLLRHHGSDAAGQRVTLNYFGRGASKDAGELRPTTPAAQAPALAPPAPATATADTADLVARFAGVPLDDEAQAAIITALTACAARARAEPPEEDRDVPFVDAREVADPNYTGQFERLAENQADPDRKPGEVSWEILDDHEHLAAIDRAEEQVAAARAARARGEDPPDELADHRAKAESQARAGRLLAAFEASGLGYDHFDNFEAAWKDET